MSDGRRAPDATSASPHRPASTCTCEVVLRSHGGRKLPHREVALLVPVARRLRLWSRGWFEPVLPPVERTRASRDRSAVLLSRHLTGRGFIDDGGAVIGDGVQTGNTSSLGPGILVGRRGRIDSGLTLAIRAVPEHSVVTAPHRADIAADGRFVVRPWRSPLSASGWWATRPGPSAGSGDGNRVGWAARC